MSGPRINGWRISSTEAQLVRGLFFAYGFPHPTSAPYRDYSVRASQSEGGQVRHGYKNVRLFWDVLTRPQALFLRNIIQEGLDDAGFIYLTIDRANGTAGGVDWIDVRGRPHMPDFDPSTPIVTATGIVHRNIELYVNNIFIVNDPAWFGGTVSAPRTITAGVLTLAGSAVSSSVT